MPGVPWDKASAQKFIERIKQDVSDPKRDIGASLLAEAKEKSQPPPTVRKRYLNERFFDGQLHTLLEKNIRDEIVTFAWFRRHIAELRKSIDATGEVKVGHIPVLLVLPRKMLRLSKLLELLEFDGAPAYTDLETDRLLDIDGFDRGAKPYLVYDVEMGVETANLSPKECEEKFRVEGRFGLLGEEGIALATHFPNLLGKYSVNLIATRYKAQFVAALTRTSIGAKLGFNFMDHRSEFWGTPSCAGRIVL
jgi:hypothetical protein